MLKGITPARAGKSSRVDDLAERLRDHPRACGEKQTGMPYSTKRLGSPPRVRGKVDRWRLYASGTGITPARAGKSWIEKSNMIRSGDHPRACGEKKTGLTNAQGTAGSPPRVRGKEFLGYRL